MCDGVHRASCFAPLMWCERTGRRPGWWTSSRLAPCPHCRASRQRSIAWRVRCGRPQRRRRVWAGPGIDTPCIMRSDQKRMMLGLVITATMTEGPCVMCRMAAAGGDTCCSCRSGGASRSSPHAAPAAIVSRVSYSVFVPDPRCAQPSCHRDCADNSCREGVDETMRKSQRSRNASERTCRPSTKITCRGPRERSRRNFAGFV